MCLFQLHQPLRSGWEAVNPSELKILKRAIPDDMKNKISSFTFYCGQDNIDQGSMTRWNFIFKWFLKCAECCYTHTEMLSFHLILCPRKTVTTETHFRISYQLICSCVCAQISMRLNRQMHFWSPPNITICLDTTLELLSHKDFLLD